MGNTTRKYQTITLRNFERIPQIQSFLSESERHAIKVVGNVLPFKCNNYVIEELIDWTNIPDDPLFQLTFPQRDMLSDAHFSEMEAALRQNLPKSELKAIADNIRYRLNPHPSGQQKNVPSLDEVELKSIQHKYREILLYFPSKSQTCHAYCTFCFRWPQFVDLDNLKFGGNESDVLARYLKQHPEITDVLITGGDPMVMSASNFEACIDPIINHHVPSLQTIRIGTKSLSYWPYKFLTDKDADDMLRVFEKVVKQGYTLAFMAHFNHPQELKTVAVRKAISRILSTGAQIRVQAPIMKHINDDAGLWSEMWKEQVKLGCTPYYSFVARDTGAQDYFAVTLEDAWNIYRKAYRSVSGIARTVKGPIMSADPGKVQILGISEVMGQKVFTLQFVQARNPEWVGQPFFAKYNPDAIWLDDLKPAFGREAFFFEEQQKSTYIKAIQTIE